MKKNGAKIELFSDTQTDVLSLQQHDEYTVMGSFKCVGDEENETRTPVDIVGVLDISGSMNGKRWESVKKTFKFIVDQLTKNDRLCIITYSSFAHRAINLCYMTEENKYKVLEFLDKVHVHGKTNIGDALLLAAKSLPEYINPLRVTSILLFTDGIVNVGLKSSDDIEKYIRKEYKNIENVSINSFGFGEDHASSFLSALSSTFNGMYHYLASEDDIPSIFAGCLAGLLSVEAQQLTMNIKAVSENVKIKRIETDNINECENEGKEYSVRFTDIQTDECRSIPIVLELDEMKDPGCQVVIELTLTYFDIQTKDIETRYCSIEINRKASKDIEDVKSNMQVDIELNRIRTVKCIKMCINKEDKDEIQQIYDKICCSLSKDQEIVKKMIKSIDNAMNVMNEEIQEDNFTSSQLCMYSSQRCNNSMDDSYRTPSKYRLSNSAKKYCVIELNKNEILSQPSPVDVGDLYCKDEELDESMTK